MLLTKVLKKKLKKNSMIPQNNFFIKQLALNVNKKSYFLLKFSKMLLTKNVGISPFSAENYNSLLSTLLLYNNNNQIVKFILKLDLRKSNIKTNILHSNGKTIFKDSSGILGFKSSNKHKKIAFNSIIKKLKFKMKNFRYFNFSLHVLGSKFSKKFITKKLNKFINLKIIKTYNLMPFNGCRPLKKKRKKFKKKLILI